MFRKNRVFSTYLYQMAAFKPQEHRNPLGAKSALAGLAGLEALLTFWMVKLSDCDDTTYAEAQ